LDIAPSAPSKQYAVWNPLLKKTLSDRICRGRIAGDHFGPSSTCTSSGAVTTINALRGPLPRPIAAELVRYDALS
jgi:hypothetical protein